MLGLSGPVRLRGLLVVLAVAIPLALTGCDSDDGPTAAQAGQTLKNHILQLLKERNAQDVTVTDPGGKNIPCGDGKAKQTFAATGEDLQSSTEPAALNSMMVGALQRVGDYAFLPKESGGAILKLSSESTRTVLLLNSQRNGQYAVQGETDCLRVS
jgi:hypothetical protein